MLQHLCMRNKKTEPVKLWGKVVKHALDLLSTSELPVVT